LGWLVCAKVAGARRRPAAKRAVVVSRRIIGFLKFGT
jgi:hypothetical protein